MYYFKYGLITNQLTEKGLEKTSEILQESYNHILRTKFQENNMYMLSFLPIIYFKADMGMIQFSNNLMYKLKMKSTPKAKFVIYVNNKLLWSDFDLKTTKRFNAINKITKFQINKMIKEGEMNEIIMFDDNKYKYFKFTNKNIQVNMFLLEKIYDEEQIVLDIKTLKEYIDNNIYEECLENKRKIDIKQIKMIIYNRITKEIKINTKIIENNTYIYYLIRKINEYKEKNNIEEVEEIEEKIYLSSFKYENMEFYIIGENKEYNEIKNGYFL
nr:Kunitz-type protease inhibitor-like protein [Ceratonova shasta]